MYVSGFARTIRGASTPTPSRLTSSPPSHPVTVASPTPQKESTRAAVVGASATFRRISQLPGSRKTSQYTKSEVWVRKDTYALAQIESFIKSQVVRRLKYSDFTQVQGIWTARRLEMHDLSRNSRTLLSLDKLEYNVPLRDEDFTLQALRNPL